MKARMSVDPRMLKLLGSKLYSEHPVVIVPRELLQNARDACIRKGIMQDISIKINNISRNLTIVTVRDNGIGMTEEQLINDFLCLGSTSKDGDATSTGKFGVAKAAIMQNSKWSVHSLDNYIDETFFEGEGKDIEKVPYLEGTEVIVQIDRPAGSYDIRKGLEAIYGSDISVHLEVSYPGCEIQVDEKAGFRNPIFPEAEAERWTLSTADEVDYGILKVTGRTFYRLNGLVQFTVGSYNDRKSNIFIDVTPAEDASAASYPFSMSRESITQDLRAEIEPVLSRLDANPVTVDQNVVRKGRPNQDVKILGSRPIHGIRDARSDKEYRKDKDGLIRLQDISNVHTDVVDLKGDGELMMFHCYKKSEHNKVKDARLLSAWREIMRLVTTEDDSFGIGLTSETGTYASRMDEGGRSFYLLNPDYFDPDDGPDKKLWIMYYRACHEATHFVVPSHGENFTVEMEEIMVETLQSFIDNFKTYKKMYKGEIQ